MLIDWFTVGAQALNFVILLWLMKRFLYQPVLAAIDAREKHVADELAAADAAKAAAKKDGDDFHAKSSAFDAERAALLAKAQAEAAAERQRLFDEARKAADTLAATLATSMADTAVERERALRDRTQAEVFAVARQTLAELADVRIEASACDLFTLRLGTIDAAGKQAFSSAMAAANNDALIRSAFDLPDTQRAALCNAINVTFSLDAHLRFETAPSLVAGIELSAGGWKFAWSINDRLKAMDRQVSDAMNAQAQNRTDAASAAARASA